MEPGNGSSLAYQGHRPPRRRRLWRGCITKYAAATSAEWTGGPERPVGRCDVARGQDGTKRRTRARATCTFSAAGGGRAEPHAARGGGCELKRARGGRCRGGEGPGHACEPKRALAHLPPSQRQQLEKRRGERYTFSPQEEADVARAGRALGCGGQEASKVSGRGDHRAHAASATAQDHDRVTRQPARIRTHHAPARPAAMRDILH
mmetsp:Transcript_23870/g.54965  ORF Transcript_23870/g.54965 Transcript_23870/m.54965 type:complete len:206 (-) Transcript_23870:31-648(-)